MEIFEGVDLADAAQAAAGEQEQRRAAGRERLEKMREYAETAACRRELLLRYLGDDFNGPCGTCDNCGAAGGSGFDTGAGARREVV